LIKSGVVGLSFVVSAALTEEKAHRTVDVVAQS
jgi:hypothetical protein